MTGCYSMAQRRQEHGKIENRRKCVTLNRNHRHGRTSLHTELPSSKAKREQILRNILAARRRHILNQRSHESSRILSNRTSRRPGDVTMKDPPDIFESQETKHTIYVTSARTGISPDDEISESSRKPIALIANIDSTNQETSKLSRNEISFMSTTQNHDGISSTSPSTIFATFTSIGQKAGDTDVRKRNIVSMTESLYNHFRPVESNIPVEDMSQFLYFGQKLQPDTHNITTNSGNNNSVEFTSTVPTSRRRYSTKRFSATIITPVEEIINDEMNIALERRTVEKNQVSRIKNTFRSSDNGIYYRKSGSKDVMSNVIPSNESSSVISRSDTRSEINSVDDKFRSDLSPHAEAQIQLKDRESTMIEVNSTIQHVSTNNNTKENVTNNDVNVKSLYETIAISTESAKSRQETTNDFQTRDEFQNHNEGKIEMETQVKKIEETERKLMDIEIASESSRISTRSRESNNIETSSTIHDKERTTPGIGISTLRIVVPEENFGQKSFATKSEPAHRNTVKQPVDAVTNQPVSTTTLVSGNVSVELLSTTESFTPVVMADQQHQQQQQQQQQHVYAYTITNVTRLLRNYTGLGSSAEERRDAAVHRDTGAEITTSGSSQQHQQQQEQEQQQQQQQHKQQQHLLPPPPPPSSPLLLPRAGSSGIEPARIAAELSAGVTVEPAAAAGSSSTVVAGLVGERLKKVVSQQRITNQQATLYSNANDSTTTSSTRSIKSTNIGYRGSIKWNHTKSRISDEEAIIGDRRFLRKSASAVLNQRSTVHEDTSLTKRRGLSTLQSEISSTANNKRVKSSSIGDKADDRSNTTVANYSALNDEVPGDFSRGITRISGVRKISDNSSLSIFAMGNTDRNSSVTDETINATDASTSLVDMITTTEEKSDVFTDVVTVSSGMRNDSDKDNIKNSYLGDESVATLDKIESNLNVTTTKQPLTVTVTERIGETAATTTAMPTAVFPVTPKILIEADRTTTVETFTLRPTDTVKAPEANNQPFGIAADLDPSEIQKRYRAKELTSTTTMTTATATATATATLTSQSTIQNDIYPVQSTSAISNEKSEVFVSSTPAITENGKRVSGERSPEVRARNLSDKSKDKDDVLPIMHLYNTSDIFNGSGQLDGFTRSTERPRVVLPTNTQPKKNEKYPVTTERTSVSIRTSSTTENNIGKHISTTLSIPISKTSTTATIPTTTTNFRKDKHEESRVSHDNFSSPAFRGSSSVPVTNRIRYNRPAYHHSILPEYNGTIYPAGLNRTFLETGPISVSPRESMNISDVISKRHDGDVIATQETVAVVSYILATLVVFPIAVGVGLILRRLILRNRKVLEESDTSSEISCRKDAVNIENGDFKTSIEKAITKLPRIQHLCHEAEKPPPPPSRESKWEFSRDKLRLQTVLGQGNFGQVWKAEADDLTGHQGTTRLVAVKTVKEGASDREKEDLVRELEIMQQLGSHPNVVTLLGCCTEEEPHYLILEYVMYGKLLAYLRDHRTRQYFYNFSEDSAALTSRDLTVFGYCVARGMEYLASKKIIHRDLAARNVLVDHNKLCKIADFGMSRFANEDGEVIETRHGRNALPIRWMAPESLIYSLFTTKTDVWSFGILMWEIVTLGSTPYPDMTAREVMRNVHNGYRLERPSHCRSELFRVISRCWHADPDRRLEFQTLRRDLAQLLEDNMNGHYVDLESFASECTD